MAVNYAGLKYPSIVRSCPFPLGFPANYSVKFLSFEISSKSSWRSISLILFARLGISVFASSAVSQHKLPPKDRSVSVGGKALYASRSLKHTELRSLKQLQLIMPHQHSFHSFDVFLLLESRKDIEIV